MFACVGCVPLCIIMGTLGPLMSNGKYTKFGTRIVSFNTEVSLVWRVQIESMYTVCTIGLELIMTPTLLMIMAVIESHKAGKAVIFVVIEGG